jgi:hypothetical protein
MEPMTLTLFYSLAAMKRASIHTWPYLVSALNLRQLFDEFYEGFKTLRAAISNLQVVAHSQDQRRIQCISVKLIVLSEEFFDYSFWRMCVVLIFNRRLPVYIQPFDAESSFQAIFSRQQQRFQVMLEAKDSKPLGDPLINVASLLF